MTLIKNIAPGARGAYLKGVLTMVEPGQTTEADDFVEEWFEPVGEHEAEEDDEGGEGLASHTVAELKAIAEAEDVDLGDATKKADIIAAIEAARAAA